MRILGISAFYHDSAAALLIDGEIAAAAQEERFTRKRHDASFPAHAVRFCLEHGLPDYVAFYDKPLLKFERLLETYLAFAPRRGLRSFSLSMPLWIREKLFQKDLLARELQGIVPPENILFAEHHLSHAASAFYPSGFDRAAVLTMDGVGEWTTTSVATGSGSSLQIEREIHFPHSLGLLYSAFTYYTGFRVNSGEYKLMGLAPYGEPRYRQTILDHLIDLKPDGSFRLDLRYFDYATGLTMTNQAFDALFDGLPPRGPEDPLTQRHMDLAASVQAVLDEAVLRLGRDLARQGHRNLCLAGGVALNCVANGKLQRAGIFDNIWIQPAAGDAGGALGAALCAHHLHLGRGGSGPRGAGKGRANMQGAYLGPAYAQPDIEARLLAIGAKFAVPSDPLGCCVDALAQGKAVGWFQGRMEFGPRALGARSILADARNPGMQSALNRKVKFRESFRPFAPSVLAEDAAEWFDGCGSESPYMLLTFPVHASKRRREQVAADGLFGIDKLNVPRSEIPAVTHVDGSARVQTVDGVWNPRYRQLLERFKAATGCPVLINTSFNVRGEPIVCSPEDAFRCFMSTNIELLCIGDCMLRKEDQDPALRVIPEFAPD
jgi:carbamoyltransferase